MGVPPEKIADYVKELGVVIEKVKPDTYTYTWRDIGYQYKEWAEKAVEIMRNNGVLMDDDAKRALEALQGARKMDAVITKATVLKNVAKAGRTVVDILHELGEILVETKAAAAARGLLK